MPFELPPSIDPVAAARWHAAAPACAPWLHEEVALRMEQRLQWLRQAPASWCHWHAVRGGLQVHALLLARYPQARCLVYESAAHCARAARQALEQPWWRPARWLGAGAQFGKPADASVHMLWANMALHMAADPGALIGQWQRALALGGCLMFSCLGPDTLRELRAVYEAMGWPPPGHGYTDMHDWGDMLVQSGFADPVMDMERIRLTFTTPERLLQELRALGCNLHPERFGALRGRRWRDRLHQVLSDRLADPAAGGQLALTFEIVYGHAIKPEPQVRVAPRSEVSLQDMRALLHQRPKAR